MDDLKPDTTVKISKVHHRKAASLAQREGRSVSAQIEYLIDTETALIDELEAATTRIRAAMRKTAEAAQ